MAIALQLGHGRMGGGDCDCFFSLLRMDTVMCIAKESGRFRKGAAGQEAGRPVRTFEVAGQPVQFSSDVEGTV